MEGFLAYVVNSTRTDPIDPFFFTHSTTMKARSAITPKPLICSVKVFEQFNSARWQKAKDTATETWVVFINELKQVLINFKRYIELARAARSFLFDNVIYSGVLPH